MKIVFVGREIIFFVFSGGDDPREKDCVAFHLSEKGGTEI